MKLDATRMGHSAKAVLLAALMAGLSTLPGGCAVQGDLEPAPPLWGEARARHEAETARKAEADAASRAGAPVPDGNGQIAPPAGAPPSGS